MRVTPERTAIVEEVFSYHEHFEAEELVERLTMQQTVRRVSRSTVYRTLNYLEEAGLLRKVARTNDREVYEHDYGYEQHDHLICRNCNTLIEFNNDEISRMLEQVAAANGFVMEGHRLEVHGLCEACSRPRRHPKLGLI
ncbi:MAG: transcriptional repressor [Planctomycetaceae bacterium]|nr:transcriptional repressor [Planctomycetaceae bacterium]